LDTKHKLLVICPYPQGLAAGQRLKYEQYFNDWRSMGVEIKVSSFFNERTWGKLYLKGFYLIKLFGVLRGYVKRVYDLFRVQKYDAIYVFMWGTPKGLPIYEVLLKMRAKKIIYDLEDNLLLNGSGQSSKDMLHFSQSKGNFKQNYLVKVANHVITSSPYLEQRCQKINYFGMASYITSSINTDLFKPSGKILGATLRIGWTGTFSSKPYLDSLRPILVELAKRVEYKLVVIGNFDYKIEGVDLELITWSKESEVTDMQSIDIGLYPLFDDEWVLGKSGLKAIQYMAFGIPTVATCAGLTPSIVEDKVTGFLVKTNDDWLNALENLSRDQELRLKMGLAARKKALELYSTDVVANKYRNVLNRVLRKI